MSNLTQMDVNRFVVEALKWGCGGGWILLVSILIWASINSTSDDLDRSSARLYLGIVLIITFLAITVGWYFSLPITRSAQ